MKTRIDFGVVEIDLDGDRPPAVVRITIKNTSRLPDDEFERIIRAHAKQITPPGLRARAFGHRLHGMYDLGEIVLEDMPENVSTTDIS
jgi:hypothetical protein